MVVNLWEVNSVIVKCILITCKGVNVLESFRTEWSHLHSAEHLLLYDFSKSLTFRV